MIIAITRLPEKAGRDRATCEQFGHSCRIVSPLAGDVYDNQIQAFVLEANRGAFDCIFFTSALPAERIAPLLETDARIIAIGPETARMLEKEGLKVETLPTYYSRDFVPYLGDWIEGKAIGIPRADVPNPALIQGIEDAGGLAYEFWCYGLVPTQTPLDTEGADAMRKGGVEPEVIGDGSLAGTLEALNKYLSRKRT